jgi:hypothetical protein
MAPAIGWPADVLTEPSRIAAPADDVEPRRLTKMPSPVMIALLDMF